MKLVMPVGRKKSMKDHSKGQDIWFLWMHSNFHLLLRYIGCPQVLFVGLQVLKKLDTLHTFSIEMPSMTVCQGSILHHIFEVSKYIKEFNDWKSHSWAPPKLSNFCQFSEEKFCDIVLPMDWRQAMTESMVSLRSTKACKDLFKEVIIESVQSKSKLSHGRVGRIVMLLLASGNQNQELYDKIARCFDVNQHWKLFILQLKDYFVSNLGQVSFIINLKDALQDTYNANWRREIDFISPHCFIYLVERLLFYLSRFQLNFYTIKSSLIEVLECENWGKKSSTFEVADVHVLLWECQSFIARIVGEILFNRQDTLDWLFKSKTAVKEDYPLLVVRLVTVICLICLNMGQYFELLSTALSRKDIKSQLPLAFCEILKRRRNINFKDVMTEALEAIGNPLVIVSEETGSSQFLFAGVLIIDLNKIQCREDIVNALFRKDLNTAQVQEDTCEVQTESSNTSGPCLPSADGGDITKFPLTLDVAEQEIQKMESGKQSDELNSAKAKQNFMHTIEALVLGTPVDCSDDSMSLTAKVPDFKVFVESFLDVLDSSTDLKDEEKEIHDKLKQLLLSVSSNESRQEVDSNIERINELVEKYLQYRPEVKPLLNSMMFDKFSKSGDETSQTSVQAVAENNNDKGKKKGKGKKGNPNPKNNKKKKGKGKK